MSKIATCIWFDTQAKEAADFYCSVIPNSRITGVTYYGEAGPGPKGSVLTVTFELDGAPYMGLNGGPHFPLSPAVSVSVTCHDQAEVDRLWETLSQGGRNDQCGWVTDRFGLSWQIVPGQLQRMLSSGDEAATARAMRAMFKMTKLDIAELERAYNG